MANAQMRGQDWKTDEKLNTDGWTENWQQTKTENWWLTKTECWQLKDWKLKAWVFKLMANENWILTVERLKTEEVFLV